MLNEWQISASDPPYTTSLTPPLKQSYRRDGEYLETGPSNHLPFPKLTLWKSLKRSRSDQGQDDRSEEISQRKKRRLRLDLVTSRLSSPYADPSTHIAGTKPWRAGAWARQRFAGGKLLRKAAILNWMAMKKGRDLRENGRIGIWPSVNATSTPCPSTASTSCSQQGPSTPLASFEYDAFDLEYHVDYQEEEQENEDDDSEDDSSEENGQAIHSDFRLLESSDTDPEFFDTSWSFADIKESEIQSNQAELEIVMENESKDEVSIAPTRLEVFPSWSTAIPV